MSIRVPIVPLPPGSSFARLIKALPHGPEYAAAQFADTPVVEHALKNLMVRGTKASVSAFTAGSAPGSELARLGVVDPQLGLMLGGQSAFEACRPRMRQIPFATPVPKQDSAGVGGEWLEEGQPNPVVQAGLFNTLKMPPVRIGSIFVLDQTLLRMPGTEAFVRDAALSAQGIVETNKFLNPAIGPSGKAPGAITHNAVEIAWDGDAAHVLGLMLSSIATQGRGLAWIGRPMDFAVLAARLGGAANLPNTMLGLPVIASPNSPAGLIVLADLAEIACGATTVEVDVSEQASIEMLDDPTNSPAAGSPEAPVATTMVSLYQAGATGYLIWRFLNWEIVRSGAVAYSVISGSPA